MLLGGLWTFSVFTSYDHAVYHFQPFAGLG